MRTEREISLHCARVYLMESRRRGKTDFAFVMLRWAANARRRAMQEPRQSELFSTAGKACAEHGDTMNTAPRESESHG